MPSEKCPDCGRLKATKRKGARDGRCPRWGCIDCPDAAYGADANCRAHMAEQREKILERAVKTGSCWRRKEGLVLVDSRRHGRVYYRCQLGLGNGTSEADFRAAFEWVADSGEKS